MGPPRQGEDWVELLGCPLPVDEALRWSVRRDCGAQVMFTGTVRDHAEGRSGVSGIEYEAYAEEVEPRLRRLVHEARRRWPALGRLVVLHRMGQLGVGDCSVVVVASAPHRAEAFEAARWCIDTLKQTVPVWKRETWAGGSGWATASQPVGEVSHS